jgi:transcriptional regulator with XRE-family HTH domain
VTQAKFTKALAAHINKLREERGLSYQQMADACEIEKNRAYLICTKGVDIKSYTLLRIAKGLGVSIADLFDFKY